MKVSSPYNCKFSLLSWNGAAGLMPGTGRIATEGYNTGYVVSW